MMEVEGDGGRSATLSSKRLRMMPPIPIDSWNRERTRDVEAERPGSENCRGLIGKMIAVIITVMSP